MLILLFWRFSHSGAVDKYARARGGVGDKKVMWYNIVVNYLNLFFMKNKKLDLVIGVLFVVALAFGVSAQGADTGTVSATLTVQNVSLTVSDGTVAYGTQSAGAMTSTLLTGDIQTVTNNGNITENFNIKGQDSANWTLASSSSTDQYTHQFSTTTGSSWTSLTTSYATLDTSKAAAATSTFDLRIYVPSASTNYTSQSVDVTVQAVAS